VFRQRSVKAFHVAAAAAGAIATRPLGLHVIPVSQITGSVGRWRELDANFRPRLGQRHAHCDERRRRIETAMCRGVTLPPIVVYRLQSEYFVLDGHHRVAAAKALGQLFIDADVIEYRAVHSPALSCSA